MIARRACDFWFLLCFSLISRGKVGCLMAASFLNESSVRFRILFSSLLSPSQVVIHCYLPF